jgi:DNA-binding CsgD family transcriptional regulator
MASGIHTDAARLTDAEYTLVREAAETEREELVVRLCGDVGLRAAEIPRIRPTDRSQAAGVDEGCFLRVRNREGEDESGREAFVPPAVAEDIERYVRQYDIEPSEPIIGVSARRVQMLVNDVAQRAAERHERPRLREVTPGQLRRLFARRLLLTNGVDPNVVFSVGGWERLDSLLATPDPPDRAAIADAFGLLREDEPATTANRLTTVVEAISEVGETLETAASPTDVRDRVTERLADTEAYTSAWFARREHHREGVTVSNQAGTELDRTGRIALESLVGNSLQSSALMVGPDRSGADPGGTAAEFAAIPVTDQGTAYGALVVRAVERDAFEAAERKALRDLGRRIGGAITAVKRQQLLSEETVLRLSVAYDDQDAVFVDLSVRLECSVALEGIIPAESGNLVCFVRVKGATPGSLLEHVMANDSTQDARLIRSYEQEALLEVVLDERSPVGIYFGHGAKIVDLSVTKGQACLVGEFPAGADIRSVVEALGEEYPSVELHSKQERAEPTDAGLAVKQALEEELTDKQRSVLRGAYHSGYFEWPRGSTAEELADSMDVSSPTLHNHLRRAQQKLVMTALEEE